MGNIISRGGFRHMSPKSNIPRRIIRSMAGARAQRLFKPTLRDITP